MPDSSDIQAERIAADQRWFEAPAAAFEKFSELLDTPLPDTDKLEALAQRPSPFEE